MSEIILPRWNSRHDIRRTDNRRDFTDLASVMVNNYYFYTLLYEAVAPYEARQRDFDEEGNRVPYVAPTPEYIRTNLRKPSFISEAQYEGAIRGVVEFCKQNKGVFALPVPHPTTIHSIQLPKGSFEINKVGRNFEVKVAGCRNSFTASHMEKPEKIKFMVMRPRSHSSGTPNLDQWELLTFSEDHGYIPLWVDSTANPRFAGSIN